MTSTTHYFVSKSVDMTRGKKKKRLVNVWRAGVPSLEALERSIAEMLQRLSCHARHSDVKSSAGRSFISLPSTRQRQRKERERERKSWCPRIFQPLGLTSQLAPLNRPDFDLFLWSAAGAKGIGRLWQVLESAPTFMSKLTFELASPWKSMKNI